MEEESYFTGDLQLFQIANTPDEAYNICSKYAVSCAGSSLLDNLAIGSISHGESSTGFQSGTSVFHSSSGDRSSSSGGSTSSSSGSRSSSSSSSSSSSGGSSSSSSGSSLNRDESLFTEENAAGGSIRNFDSELSNLGHISGSSGNSEVYGENEINVSNGYYNSLGSDGEIVRKKNQTRNRLESENLSTTPFYSQYESQTMHPLYVERPIDSGLGPYETDVNPTSLEVGSSPTGTEYASGYPNSDYGVKGEPGRDGLDGQTGIQGPPGHVFMIPLNQGGGNEKGPDTHADSLRQMLSQHMVCVIN